MKKWFLVLFVCVGLFSGCILSGTPDDDPVFVYPGNTKTFSAKAFPASVTLVWTLDGEEVQSGGSEYIYMAEESDETEHLLKVRETGVMIGDSHEWNITHDADKAPSYANNPHIPSKPGPWFEGWYMRVTDAGGSRSIAIIGASSLPKDESYVIGEYLPGYINVLICEGDGAPTSSYTVFPEKTMSFVNGEPVAKNPELNTLSDFEWVAEGYGTITEDCVDLTIPGVLDLHIQTENRLPFNTVNPDIGPYSALDLLPLPLRWWIHSLGSDAQYRYTVLEEDTPEVIGTGYAHLEKNWGAGFPIGWVWGQGIAEDNQAQFVVSTAEVDFGFMILNAWIAAYRSSQVSWDFRFSMPDMVFYTERDGCEGTFLFEIVDGNHKLVFNASAPPDTFGDVSTPSEDGFAPETGGESFSTTVEVTAFVDDDVVDQTTFHNAALEFGTGYMCQE